MFASQIIAGLGPIVKSIQFGDVVGNSLATSTATITSVSTANSVVIPMGFYRSVAGVAGGYQNTLCKLELTNATTVTGTRVSADGNMHVKFCVIEFYPGVLKSVQRGVITLANVTSNTASISSVDTTKSAVICLGITNNEGGIPDRADEFVLLTLTSATVVTASKFLNEGGTSTISYEVWEFY